MITYDLSHWQEEEDMHGISFLWTSQPFAAFFHSVHCFAYVAFCMFDQKVFATVWWKKDNLHKWTRTAPKAVFKSVCV